jgi:uncharacterized protein (TIGR03083 family)
LEAYRRAVVRIDALLAQLIADEWRRPTLRNLDVQGVVGHLIGVEHHFRAGSGLAPPIEGADDHIASTEPYAAAQAGRAPADTRAELRSETDATIAALTTAGDQVMDRPATLHGITLPLGYLLLVRAFEVWTHDDDIRRATGRNLAHPDDASLALMTRLAVALLPAGMARAHGDPAGRSVRLVLTGAGGGTWPAALAAGADRDSPPAPAARIVADTVMFCRLVANRADPKTFPAQVSGDEELARDVFAGAAALAFD